MEIKLECACPQAIDWIVKNWAETIRQGNSVICLNIPGDELAYIQQQTGAHTVELTEHDKGLVCDWTVGQMAKD